MHRKVLFYLEEVERLIQNKYQFPITFEIDASNYCQNNCSFCMYKDYLNSNRVHLDYDIYLKALNTFENTVKSITFTGGGEPTMNPRFKEMVIEARNRGLEIGLITNGIKLYDLVDLLQNFKFVRISLDAATSETYEKLKGIKVFDTIVNGIRKAVETCKRENLDTTIGLSFVINETNKHEVSIASKLAAELETDYIQFKPCYGTQLDSKDVTESKNVVITNRFEISSNLPCKIAGLVGILTADGKIYYCCQHRGEAEFEVGDLHNSTLEELVTKRISMNPDISKCVTCRYMNYTKGYLEFMELASAFVRHKNFL